ncbi:Putative sulphate anion transporter [Magnetospira sp. QH-2]|nr:Putative sulphate anion transporter [Magnetospira sp. QH-2]
MKLRRSGYLANFTPFTKWLPKVERRDAKADLIAGLAGAFVVLPQGVAFATIAGMPPEYGLYAGMIPAIIAALFGSSRHLVSGPTTAASIVLFSALSIHAVPGSMEYVALALTLTFMVGLFELALGLARMGVLVNFISHSVVVGFTAGAALLIAAKQLKHFFGVELPSGGHFHDIVIAFMHHLGQINPYATAVAATTLIIGILFKRFMPRIPYLIAAMVFGTLVGVGLDAQFGNEVTHLATIGALPASFPPLSAPDLSLDHIKALVPTALAVTLFALTEAVSIGRSLADRGGYRINGNQEFIGQGLSNIAGSFFSGYVATGSFNRSGLNFEAGARTPLAAIFAGGILMLLVPLIAPYAIFLPKATMAGVLFIVAWGLIDFKKIRHILKGSRREGAVLLVTFLSALFLELEFAIFAGVLLSLVLYLERTSKPTIRRHVPDPNSPKRAMVANPRLPDCPQFLMLRIDGSIFFGSVARIQDAFDMYWSARPSQKHLAVVADAIRFVDMEGGEAFVAEARRRQEAGGGFYMIHVQPQLWDAMESCGCMDKVGDRRIFQSKTDAIHGIYQKLDKSVCATCTKRVFRECQKEFGPAAASK